MKTTEKRRYVFRGAVINQFGSVMAESFYASTLAVSEAQAKNNIAAQFKRLNRLDLHARVKLVGKVAQTA